MTDRLPEATASEAERLRRGGWMIGGLFAAFGLFLLWGAFEFWQEGSSAAAVVLLIGFIGFELFAFVAVPYMFGIRRLRR
jgi:hypothetical protein